jgi:hypothetical protein
MNASYTVCAFLLATWNERGTSAPRSVVNWYEHAYW